MAPYADSAREGLYTRNTAMIAVVYCFTASAVTLNREVDFDYRLSLFGAIAYVFVEGAFHMREFAKFYQLRLEGRTWLNPDCTYHFIKAVAGIIFFGMIFGRTELMLLAQNMFELATLACRMIFEHPL